MAKTRILFGLLAGAATGGLLIAGWYLFGQFVVHGLDYVLKYGAQNGFAVFTMAFVVWLAGILLFATPIWWLLHRANLRGWRSAAVLGFALTFLVVFALSTNGFGPIPAREGSTFSASDSGGATWVNNELTAHGWAQAFWSSLWFSLGGMISALATWRVAYQEKFLNRRDI